MSSRFVSSGKVTFEDDPKDDHVEQPTDPDAGAGAATSPPPAIPSKKQLEWEAVQRELDAERRARQAHARTLGSSGTPDDTRSLFAILQANKEARQAAAAERHSIRSQFPGLADADVEYLDDVAAAQREAAARVRRETEDGLAAFRAARGGGGSSAAHVQSEEGVREDWGALGRKRKRVREGRPGLGAEAGKKVRSAGAEAVRQQVGGDEAEGKRVAVATEKAAPAKAATATPAAPVVPAKPLVAYGSDSE